MAAALLRHSIARPSKDYPEAPQRPSLLPRRVPAARPSWFGFQAPSPPLSSSVVSAQTAASPVTATEIATRSRVFHESPPESDWLENEIEKTIYRFRFMALMGVFGSLVGSLLCFIKGCTYVASSFAEYAAHRGKVVFLLVEAVVNIPSYFVASMPGSPERSPSRPRHEGRCIRAGCCPDPAELQHAGSFGPQGVRFVASDYRRRRLSPRSYSPTSPDFAGVEVEGIAESSDSVVEALDPDRRSQRLQAHIGDDVPVVEVRELPRRSRKPRARTGDVVPTAGVRELPRRSQRLRARIDDAVPAAETQELPKRPKKLRGQAGISAPAPPICPVTPSSSVGGQDEKILCAMIAELEAENAKLEALYSDVLMHPDSAPPPPSPILSGFARQKRLRERIEDLEARNAKLKGRQAGNVMSFENVGPVVGAHEASMFPETERARLKGLADTVNEPGICSKRDFFEIKEEARYQRERADILQHQLNQRTRSRAILVRPEISLVSIQLVMDSLEGRIDFSDLEAHVDVCREIVEHYPHDPCTPLIMEALQRYERLDPSEGPLPESPTPVVGPLNKKVVAGKSVTGAGAVDSTEG